MQDKNLDKLQNVINYKFKNKSLLIESLSHPSLKHDIRTDKRIVKDYERLEILGDSILGFVITEILFFMYREDQEGKISKIRAALVCKDSIYNIAKKLSLGDYLIMNHGEENSGGRENKNNIENAMEALIAAIYIDSNIEITKNVIQILWKDMLCNPESLVVDYKTSLQELSQGLFEEKPRYEIVSKIGPVHSPLYTVEVFAGPYLSQGIGKSIKAAEKEAAKNLLTIIESDSK